MLWIFIILGVLLIFFGTITIKVPEKTLDNICNINNPWVKVKLRINSDIKASWCRVIPGVGVNYYSLDGTLIDHNKDRVSVIEICTDSNPINKVPSDDILSLVNNNYSNTVSSGHNPSGLDS